MASTLETHRLPAGSHTTMLLRYALLFLALALGAGFLGFGGVVFAAAGLAKILFAVFFLLFIVGLVVHLGWGTTAA